MRLPSHPCIALLEFSSIAAGVAALDDMLKDAPVRIVLARPVSPGKYLILVTGDVDPVKSAVAAGRVGRVDALVDELVLPNAHEAIYAALNGPVRVPVLDAVAVIETSSAAAAIVAADLAVKMASVTLLDLRLANGLGGKGYLVLCGEIGDLEAAVEAGAASARERNKLVRHCVLPRPHPDLIEGLYA